MAFEGVLTMIKSVFSSGYMYVRYPGHFLSTAGPERFTPCGMQSSARLSGSQWRRSGEALPTRTGMNRDGCWCHQLRVARTIPREVLPASRQQPAELMSWSKTVSPVHSPRSAGPEVTGAPGAERRVLESYYSVALSLLFWSFALLNALIVYSLKQYPKRPQY